MAMLVIPSLVTVAPGARGTDRARGTALLEPWADPRESGLYNAPQHPQRLGAEHAVITSGNHRLVGLPRRQLSEG